MDLNEWIHEPEPEPEVARSSVADFDFDLGTSPAAPTQDVPRWAV